jgi:prepilin-type N-terminal cleavage/methylation domain-containing protein
MSRQRGFTLIEVLVATGILVTVAAGSAQLFAMAISQDVAARQQLAMSTAARDKLEALAGAVGAGAAPTETLGALDRPIAGFSDRVVASGAAVERRWIVAPLHAYSPTAVAIVVRVVPLARTSIGDVEIAAVREARAP